MPFPGSTVARTPPPAAQAPPRMAGRSAAPSARHISPAPSRRSEAPGLSSERSVFVMGFRDGPEVVYVMTDFTAEREAMVDRQLRRRGITEELILDAFRAVPREAFVSPEQAHLAYGDHPLPIEAGQTISQPYIVALMIQAAGVTPGDKVLEIGSGSGYAAAVISRIAGRVIGTERQHDLVEV